MSDTVFRTKIETPQQTDTPQVAKNNGPTPSVVNVEVPYNSYEQTHGRPYLADHFSLGDTWESFNQEVGLLDNYLKSKISSGEIADSPTAIKKIISQMEKMNNLKDEERTVVKLGVLSSYVKFLMSKEDIRKNVIKYGNS